MRLLVILCMLAAISCQDDAPMVKKADATTVKEASAALPDEIKEEDCDDKAKEQLEKEITEVSLQGGDTGCSLEE